MAPSRKPDMIAFPPGRFKKLDAATHPVDAIAQAFGPVLGCRRVAAHPPKPPLRTNIVYAAPEPLQLKGVAYPTMHPKAGQDLYDWFEATYDPAAKEWTVADEPIAGGIRDHGNRVLFGYLKPDATPYPDENEESGDYLA